MVLKLLIDYSFPVVFHSLLSATRVSVVLSVEVSVDVDSLVVVQSLRAEVAEVHFPFAHWTATVHAVAPAVLLHEEIANWTSREVLALDHQLECLLIPSLLLFSLFFLLPLLLQFPQLFCKL